MYHEFEHFAIWWCDDPDCRVEEFCPLEGYFDDIPLIEGQECYKMFISRSRLERWTLNNYPSLQKDAHLFLRILFFVK